MNKYYPQGVLIRARERRAVEDVAPRLLATFPRLTSLRLQIWEMRGAGVTSRSQYVRHVVVASAPASFDIPCVDSGCGGGSHDITSAVLRGLKMSLESFEGKADCNGEVGSAVCECSLRFEATATYSAEAPETVPGAWGDGDRLRPMAASMAATSRGASGDAREVPQHRASDD